MPRKLYRRRRTRKPSWYNKKYSTLQLAKKSWTAVKYLKGLVNSERMYSDTQHTSTAQSAIFRLVNLSQGDNSSARTGNSILLRSIYMRGHIQINSSVPVATRCTLAIVRDMQQVSDTTPLNSEIFEDYTDPESMLSRTSAGRFKLVMRKSFVLTPVSGGKPVRPIKEFLSMREHLRWNGSNTADVQKGHYYLCLLTSEATNFPTLDVMSRVSYHDN